MDELDEEIARCKEQIEKNSIPMRMRYKQLAPKDGYDNYLTEVEQMVSYPFVAAYTEKLRCLTQLKKIIEESEHEHTDEQH